MKFFKVIYVLLLPPILFFSCQRTLNKNPKQPKAELTVEDTLEDIEEDVDILPEYILGPRFMYRDLARNINLPAEASRAGASGRVTVRFIVEKDGRISNLKLIERAGYGYDEEALRVVKLLDKWKPAIKNGQAVRAWKDVPIVFSIR